MKIRVNKDLCQGHARCFAIAPDLFPIDDFGYSALDGEFDVPSGRESDAVSGANSCPERAIEIIQ